MSETLAVKSLPELLSHAVEARWLELVAMRPNCSNDPAHEAEWLRGLDDLSPGTYEVLTVAVIFPE
ncbi:MAG: hypothetical protein KJ077_27835 [Anaerolineae bacterium]|nr:hypothetical protein [Anaerolineae bacterium]